MTVPHDTRPLAAASAPAALATLRARGLRITRSRRVVVEALFAADAPVGAEQIAGGLGGRVPRTDLASVYRNLEALERAGLVRHVHAGHGAGRYSLASRRDDGYAACEHCGVLAPLDLESVIRVEAIVGIYADANASRDVKVLLVYRMHFRYLGQDSCGRIGSLFQPRHFGQQHDEFIAALPADRLPAAYGFTQTCRDGLQKFVADCMAK